MIAESDVRRHRRIRVKSGPGSDSERMGVAEYSLLGPPYPFPVPINLIFRPCFFRIRVDNADAVHPGGMIAQRRREVIRVEGIQRNQIPAADDDGIGIIRAHLRKPGVDGMSVEPLLQRPQAYIVAEVPHSVISDTAICIIAPPST